MLWAIQDRQYAAAERQVATLGLGTVVLLLGLASAVQAGLVTIFSDDFEAYEAGGNPGSPPIGQPWQVVKTAADGIAIAAAGTVPDNKSLRFGRYWNKAAISFSVEDQTLIAAKQNLTFSFLYQPLSDNGFMPYFDVAGLNPALSEPAFMIRMMPQPISAGSPLHGVYYLDPAGGLRNSGLNVTSDAPQLITLTADFAAHSYRLGIGEASATLPFYTCPSEISGVQLSGYMMGSGGLTHTDVDNATATVHSPEPGTIALLGGGVIVMVLVWWGPFSRSRK